MDRVPISEAVDKVEPTEETPAIPVGVGGDKGLSEMQDLGEMSMMLGFDGPGFDGMGREAEGIYKWAKEMTDGSGTEALRAVKMAIKISGINAKGKELLAKLHRWTSIDRQISELRKQRGLLHG